MKVTPISKIKSFSGNGRLRKIRVGNRVQSLAIVGGFGDLCDG